MLDVSYRALKDNQKHFLNNLCKNENTWDSRGNFKGDSDSFDLDNHFYSENLSD